MMQEIFKVLPAYKRLPAQLKISVLTELRSWCDDEIKLIEEEPKENIKLKELLNDWKNENSRNK